MRRIVLAVLMITALVALPLVALPAQAEEHGHTVALPATLKWAEPAPLPGALLAVVQGDPSKDGLFSVPPDHPHYAWVGGTETIVQVHGMGPTDLRFVNPEDDPRKKK